MEILIFRKIYLGYLKSQGLLVQTGISVSINKIVDELKNLLKKLCLWIIL